ncbi:exodeoxyribonuclease III [Hydromonas duriensis]|uniref:Exodeoxyribonuclease-3 n=1 Tax=Hydromonas duriensis TaxID=1527608 RepID=A0A4R6YBL3_9BURK|nr:exodeoxyribonuclease III [Hydromonas duriensis]TDR33032.1 exodeoxyribonuclease-3 [Hydromonas duriensis]
MVSTRIICANLNGIRSAASKGFFDWLGSQNPDFVCVQELKAQQDNMQPEFITPHGMTGYFHYAQKKGYSGVGLYSRVTPDDVIIGFDQGEFDNEGRYVEARFGKLSVISVYFPSGSSAPERQEAKYRFLDLFLPHIANLRAQGRELVICGDVNIAHHEIDLKNWKGNLKNSGFLPEERAWLTQFLQAVELKDVFRVLEPNTHQYTWWSNRGQARANNVGWRIDYQFATPLVLQHASTTSVYTETKFSDHAPIIMDYAADLTQI